MLKKIVVTVMVLTMLLSTAALAQTWGDWHVVTLPNGSTDLVRVHHGKHGTQCDFLRRNDLDIHLIAIGVSYKACVPTKDV